MFAGDGNYLALDAHGDVWAWGGNLDHSSYGRPVRVPSGAGTTMDLNIWGLHYNHAAGNRYYGGGYVIKGTATCPVPGA